MRRRIPRWFAGVLWFCLLSGLAFAQLREPLPRLNYDMMPDFFQLPPGEHLIEPAGVAVNSKGHIYVFHRGKIHSWNSTLPANSYAASPMICS
jgi:hypothetical protein